MLTHICAYDPSAHCSILKKNIHIEIKVYIQSSLMTVFAIVFICVPYPVVFNVLYMHTNLNYLKLQRNGFPIIIEVILGENV
ncbi:hypothetical protein GQX74_015551 [Glossina fuscipes]|nr:hypothetical protein GQX74_015551 [Glossina fuscipes]